MRRLVLLVLLMGLLVGCGSDNTRDTSAHQTKVSRVETHPTSDGGTVVITKETVLTDSHEQGHSEVDLTPPPAVMGALTGLATGGWGDVAAGLATLVFGGYGIVKHRENTRLKAKIPKPHIVSV